MEDRLEAEGALLAELAIPVLQDVVSALTAAHAIGIVHRDVRPANVLWDEENDKALLVDFGISALFPSGVELPQLDRTGSLMGDPQYSSPEQIRDDDVTVLADMYGFGVMAYQFPTGQGPYGPRTDAQLIEAHLHGEPKDLLKVRDDVEPNIADALRRCLNKEPKHRPSASNISRALDGVWQMQPQEGDGGRRRTLIEKKRMGRAVAGGFVASGFVAGGVATLNEQYEFMPDWAFTESLATGGRDHPGLGGHRLVPLGARPSASTGSRVRGTWCDRRGFVDREPHDHLSPILLHRAISRSTRGPVLAARSRTPDLPCSTASPWTGRSSPRPDSKTPRRHHVIVTRCDPFTPYDRRHRDRGLRGEHGLGREHGAR